MRKNSVSSQASRSSKLLYSFSSIGFSEVEDNCFIDDKRPDMSSFFNNRSLISGTEKEINVEKSDSCEEYFSEAMNNPDLKCPLFKSRLIGSLMTENGSKQIQKNMSKYSQSCFVRVYSTVSFFLL